MDFYSSKEWLETKAMHPGGTRTTNWLIEHGNLQKEAYVLDLCCGRGDGILELLKRGIRAVGVDHSEEALEKAREWIQMQVHLIQQDIFMGNPTLLGVAAETELISCNAWELPFAADSFPAVLCECSLTLTEHRIGDVVQEIYRVLEPGGLLLLSDLYAKNDRQGIETEAGWSRMLRAYGLEREVWQDETTALHQYALEYLWEKEQPFPMCTHGVPEHVKLKDVGYFAGVWRKIYG